MKSLIKQLSPQIDWSNYSKSTVAVALDITFGEDDFKTKWMEHNEIPHVCFTFWSGGGHNETKEIKPQYAPIFKGDWKKSLCIRPEIEERARQLLKLTGECHTWDMAVIDTINSWIEFGHEMTVNRLKACRKRLTDTAIRGALEANRRKNEPEKYTCAKDEERIA